VRPVAVAILGDRDGGSALDAASDQRHGLPQRDGLAEHDLHERGLRFHVVHLASIYVLTVSTTTVSGAFGEKELL